MTPLIAVLNRVSFKETVQPEFAVFCHITNIRLSLKRNKYFLEKQMSRSEESGSELRDFFTAIAATAGSCFNSRLVVTAFISQVVTTIRLPISYPAEMTVHCFCFDFP
jgi:hypothetical protein